MERTIRLIGVVAVAMALTIAFTGVAIASPAVPPTKETETVEITTDVTCSGTVVESQEISLEIDSVNLLDNLPLDEGEIYGKIKYDEKMIGSSGTTDFDKCFNVDTGTAPNLYVHKQIGYSQGFLGSLSHDEQVGMKIIAAGKPAETKTCKEKGSPEHEEWKQETCPFKYPCKDTTVPAVPASCEEVNTYSEMVVTNVHAETETKVGITAAPINLHYAITAAGSDGAGTLAQGSIAAEFSVYTDEGRGACCVPGTPGTEGQCTGSCSGHSEEDCTDPCTWEHGTEGQCTGPSCSGLSQEECTDPCTWNETEKRCTGPSCSDLSGHDCTGLCTWTPGTEGHCTGPSCSDLSGHDCTTPGTERHCTYPLGSRMTYYEKSTANGLWEFSKVIDYKSMISGSG
jgi:hypothetical protein